MRGSKTKQRKRKARKERVSQASGGISRVKRTLAPDDYDSNLHDSAVEGGEEAGTLNVSVQGGTRAYAPGEGE